CKIIGTHGHPPSSDVEALRHGKAPCRGPSWHPGAIDLGNGIRPFKTPLSRPARQGLMNLAPAVPLVKADRPFVPVWSKTARSSASRWSRYMPSATVPPSVFAIPDTTETMRGVPSVRLRTGEPEA